MQSGFSENNNNLSAIIKFPTEALESYVESKSDFPVEIIFDGSGPTLSYQTPGGLHSGPIKIQPADMQKNLYYRGKRFWKNWPQFEQNDPKTKKNDVIIIIAFIVLLFIAVWGGYRLGKQ